jgi:RNA polymerase sigma factor (sigma-70 family)
MSQNIDVMDHEGFIKQYIYKRIKSKELQEELLQVGYLGLLEAKQRFNPAKSKSGNYLTYAGLFAIGRMKQYLREVVYKHSKDFCEYRDDDNPTIGMEETIIRDETLTKVCEFIDNYERKDRVEAFKAVHLREGLTTRQLADKYNLSIWGIIQRARELKRDLMKHING